MNGDDVDRVDENRRRLVRGDRRRLPPARAQPAGSLDARAPRRTGARGEAGRRALDRRAGRSGPRAEQPTASRSRSRASAQRPAGVAVVARRLAGTARWDRCRERGRALGGRLHRGGDRPSDRTVLLRGRDDSRRARSRLRFGPDRLRRPEPRSLERRRPRRCAKRASSRSSASTSARHCHPELFFSHRRDRQATRRPGSDRACRLSAFGAAYERIQAEVGANVTVVARDEVRAARGDGGARRGGRRGRSGRTAPRISSAKHARLRRRVSLAFHRPPAVATRRRS